MASNDNGTRNRWEDPTIPHKGWICVDVVDVGANMVDVCPYDKMKESSRASDVTRQQFSKQQYKDMITLTEKKDASGTLESWVLKIPYFRRDMFIETKFPAAMKEDDVRYFHRTVQEIIAN